MVVISSHLYFISNTKLFTNTKLIILLEVQSDFFYENVEADHWNLAIGKFFFHRPPEQESSLLAHSVIVRFRGIRNEGEISFHI